MFILARLGHRIDREFGMIVEWLSRNRMAVRVGTSAGGMIVLAVVVAAPSKWS
jgi:protease II